MLLHGMEEAMMGGYVKQTLSDGESIVFETRLHWIKLIFPLIWLCFMGLVARTSVTVFNETAFPYILLALFSVPSFISFITSEFAVTTKRLVVKVGWLRRKTIEINVQKVESAAIDQGLLGRMLGYGSITFTGTGGTREHFKGIARPFQVRTALMNIQIQKATTR